MNIGSRILLLALVLAGAAGTACSVADVDGSRAAYDKKSGDDDDDDDAGAKKTKHKAGDDDDDDSAPAKKSTTSTTDSAKLDAGPPPVADPFAGAASFTTMTLGTDTSRHHLGDSNAGKDCLSCHNGSNTAPGFELGGTVRETGGSSDGATGVQVRIVDPAGTEVALVGTDSQGNFWLKGTTKIPAGSHVAIRDASGEKKMSGTIGNGSCNTAGCHDPNRPIFLNAGGSTGN
jgi:hypothetical protein